MRTMDRSRIAQAHPGRQERPDRDLWRDNEAARRRQLHADGRRSPAENLAEGLALIEFFSTFAGAAKR